MTIVARIFTSGYQQREKDAMFYFPKPIIEKYIYIHVGSFQLLLDVG